MGGGDYLLRGSRPQPENQREKALHLGFPFLGSCVWVLQCLKERQSKRLRNRFLLVFCLGVGESKFYRVCFREK